MDAHEACRRAISAARKCLQRANAAPVGGRPVEANSGVADSAAKGKLSVVIDALTAARKVQQRLAVAFGLVALAGGVGGVWFLTTQATGAFDKLKDASDAHSSNTAITAETAFLIVRGAGLAAIVGGISYFLFNLARSSLDQATRYEKRLIASHLIDYVLHEPNVSPDKLEAAYKIVEVWGSTVESAYTPPRVAKRVSGLSLGVSRDSASLKSDVNQP